MPVLPFHHELCQRKPNSRTVLLGILSSVKPLKQMWQVLFCKSLPLIPYSYLHIKRIFLIGAVDGSVYPCDFYVMDSYCLGNITTTDLTAINQKRKELGFIEASEKKPSTCLSCKYYFLCRGGCMRYRVKTDDTELPKNYLCPAYHQFFAHSLTRLKELAQLVARVL